METARPGGRESNRRVRSERPMATVRKMQQVRAARPAAAFFARQDDCSAGSTVESQAREMLQVTAESVVHNNLGIGGEPLAPQAQ